MMKTAKLTSTIIIGAFIFTIIGCSSSYNKPSNKEYINITINKKKYYLHRLIYKYHNDDFDITDISHNNEIDHIDINPTNNKIENLRAVNHSINQRNKNKSKNCSSKYIGVSWKVIIKPHTIVTIL